MKIVCPKCEKINDVSKDTKVVTCSGCGEKFSIDVGKEKTVQKYKELHNRAYMCLYRLQVYEKAIECYEACLEIKPNDFSSVIGICLAKTSLSKLDNTNFKDVEKIIDSYDIYLDLENSTIFLDFTSEMIDQINFYLRQVDERLINNETFISKKYFDGYLNSIIDIKNLLAYLRKSQEFIDNKVLESYLEDNQDFAKKEEDVTKNINERMNKMYNVNHFGDIKVTDGNQEIIGSNKIDLENDEIDNLDLVVKNEKGLLYQKTLIPASLFFGVIGIILLFVFTSNKNIIVLIVSIISILLGLLIYGLYKFLLRKTLRK